MAQSAFITAICVLVLSHSFILGVEAITFTILNKCNYVVWPGILSNAGIPPLPTTGFTLQKGETKTITAPKSWGGRFWGRTHCSQDSAGKFSCLTGDCGSGKLECSGNGAAPPATLAEFTLNGANGLDFFDVSLVDGYNIPMLVVPQGGKAHQNCSSTGCVADLNGSCPLELRVMSIDGRDGVACKSACEAFRQPQFCCSGAYRSPDICKPSSYSRVFKKACPRAYSYAFDDKSSTFTCANAHYTITFCPPPNTSSYRSLRIPALSFDVGFIGAYYPCYSSCNGGTYEDTAKWCWRAFCFRSDDTIAFILRVAVASDTRFIVCFLGSCIRDNQLSRVSRT